MVTKLKPTRLKANIDPLTGQYVIYDDDNGFSYTSEGGSGIVIDPQLSEQSTNPVQNKAIAQGINAIAEDLSGKANVEDVPTITPTANEATATEQNTLYLITQQ